MFGFALDPTFWIAAGAVLAVLLLVAFARKLRWMPALIARTVLLMLVLAAMLIPEKRVVIDPPPLREILILDQSDSVSPDLRGEARARARQWLAEGENRLVIVVGMTAVPVDRDPFPAVDGSATDMASAIDLAAGFLGESEGRVILATDGRTDHPLEVLQSLEALAAEGSGRTVETISLRENAFPTDIYAGELYLPTALWENTPFTAVLPIHTFLPGDVQISVQVNDSQVIDEVLNLPAGQHLIPLALQTTVSEILTISAQIHADGDPRPENNTAHAALRVFEAPRVLIVTEDAVHAGEFSLALANLGLEADLALPEDLPGSQTALSVYEVILVDNILAERFSERQFMALKEFVQQLGKGVIFSGGRNAFTLGGYTDTILEPMLPVRLEPPPREQDSPLTLVLVIDRSASMDGARGTPNNLRPIALAREAALRSVETLGPEDYLGILSYNATTQWSLPLLQVGSGDTLQNAKNAMAGISPSGGTAIFNALNTAVTEILAAPTSETRHIVLLSDGNDDTPLEDYAALAEFAGQEDITISTIALGVEADQALMALLAEAGKGRFYPVLQATDLPRILIDETRAARDENIREGFSRADVGEDNHPVLSGLTVGAMPGIIGYNALESKTDQGAEDVLLSAPFEDPLLSVWQYGLGRVAAWTGDLGQEWSSEMTAWDQWGRLWANLVRYTLPDPTLGPGQVLVTVNPAEIEVLTRVTSAAGVPQNGVPVSFRMVDRNGQIITYPLAQEAPGQYMVRIPRPEAGAYRGVVQYIDEDGIPVEFAAPVVVNYPREWQPGLQGEFDVYGSLVTWSDLIPERPAQAAVVLEPDQTLQRLLILLILSWPIEIAIRRRWMPWR